MRFPSLAPKPQRFPLLCDPAIKARNTREALAHAQESGDYTGLDVPADATHVVVTPMTPMVRAELDAAAGPRDPLGWALQVARRAPATPEETAAAHRLAGRDERLMLLGIDRCCTVEGAPEGMSATEALGAILGETPEETAALRLAARLEVASLVWVTGAFGHDPKAR